MSDSLVAVARAGGGRYPRVDVEVSFRAWTTRLEAKGGKPKDSMSRANGELACLLLSLLNIPPSSIEMTSR
jgi:hypothetical protein